MSPTDTDPGVAQPATTGAGLAPVLAIFGPTAAGKSALAHAAARVLDGEIVVADPFQRYRGLEIAADSPRPRERAEVPYHLAADLELTEGSSAGDYAAQAHAAVDDIAARGRVPIVAGGTGLYLRAALCELDFPDPPPPHVRAWAEDLVARDPEAAAAELRRRAPAAADRIHLANPRRLVRALERTATGEAGSDDRLWDAPPRRPTLLVAVTRPRPVLDVLIATRVRRELDEGLVAELERALGTPGVAREPLQIIGAKEVAAVHRGETPPERLPELLAARTRQLARRQSQWLRRLAPGATLDLGEAPATDALPTLVALWEAFRAGDGAVAARPAWADGG